MKNRSRIITIIAICGVTMFMLLISPYKNLNAQSDAVDKSGGKLAYQAKGKKKSSGKQDVGKDASPRSKNPDVNRDKDLKVDEDFYRVIVENNLFRNLGWRKPNRKPQYTLIATLIESKGNISKAFMMEQRENQYYYVSVGEKMGDAIVRKIQSNEVTLYRAGNTLTIHAESRQFLSSSDGKGGGYSPPNRENRPNRNSENRDGKQPNLRDGKQPNLKEMKNRFQNVSPEERKRMLEQYRKMQGSKEQSKGSAGKEDKGRVTDKRRDDKGEVGDKGRDDKREVEDKER